MIVKLRKDTTRARGFVLLLLGALGWCLIGCGESKEDAGEGGNSGELAGGRLEGVPLVALDAGAEGGPLFERLSPEEVGVAMVNEVDLAHPLKRLYYSYAACGGMSLGDFNGDGQLDLFCANGAGSNRLYLQREPWTFEDATEGAGVGGGEAWASGTTAVDIEGDGDLDLYVCNYDEPNHLFVNDGKGRFTERAAEFGLDFADASVMPYFADFDRDGDLDVYLLTYALYREGGRPREILPTIATEDGGRELTPEWARYYKLERTPGGYSFNESGRPDYLLRNEGGRFVEVSEEVGLPRLGELGNSVMWWDYDQDGWPDLYVANDLSDPDHLYRNEEGTFREVSAEVIPHTTFTSMGSAMGDLNNDGWMDALVVDMLGSNHFRQKTSMGSMNAAAILAVAGPPAQVMRNAVYLNTGAGRMQESAFLSGLAETDWSWSPKLADFDCDGRLDLSVTNGAVRDFMNSDVPAPRDEQLFGRTQWSYYEDGPERREQNFVFRNVDGIQFKDVSKTWGLDHVGVSYASVVGDIDGDGDLDYVTANVGEPVALYRNRAEGARVVVHLEGNGGNRFGIGTRVELEAGGQVQTRVLTAGSGYLSSDEPIVSFGVGAAERIDRLTVRWPRGGVQEFGDLAVDHRYTVRESKAGTAPAESGEKGRTLFVDSTILEGSGRAERPFDDFKDQPLLPNKLSQLGSGMAWGDVDGDGDPDVYFGRPAGVGGAVYLNEGGGRFVVDTFEPFDQHAASEDMGALFFDADGDDDLDLYVASGSNEWAVGHERYQDRLYFNKGDGTFENAPEGSLPDLRESSSVVAAADFDRDGDLDLFVGARVIPGRYPLSPSSRLLRNEGGRFTDVTGELAPSLLKAGLITSALWSDATGDDWPDLLLTREWGSLGLLRNERGVLADVSEETGVASLTGWWNGIAAGDVDRDGDMDYAVSNFGRNSKYHASPEKPVVLFYGDLDGSGVSRLVEAEYEGDRCYPIRGRSCSVHAMPALGERFKTFKDFASASLEEIYPKSLLETAQRFEAATLESGIFLNEGAGKFRFEPFALPAQLSVSFGVLLADVDGDNLLDCLLAQNFSHPQLETGAIDGGTGMVLKGDGNGGFAPLPPRESGVVVSQDGRSLVLVDVDSNGIQDLVIGVNGGEPRVFLSKLSGGTRVVLRSNGANRDSVGAGVVVKFEDDTVQAFEVVAGGGYLSQGPSELRLPTSGIRSLSIRWPDGSSSDHAWNPTGASVTIEKP